MTSLRELHVDDLFKFNLLVFDPLTEVYCLSFFMRHFAQWPEMALAATAPDGSLVGFIFGKCLVGPKEDDPLHGHVCVLTISQNYRRLGIATLLMNSFALLQDLHGAWFLDLYLRCSNKAAYSLYSALGYVLYRQLLQYYPGENEEDAFHMRKPLSIDMRRMSIIRTCTEPMRLPSEEDSDGDYFSLPNR